MSGLDWGLDQDTPRETPAQPADPRECPTCRRLPLHDDPRAAALLLAQVRAEARDRLSRTESALATMHEGDRIAVAAWIQSALDRPPLAGARSRSFAPIVAVLDALWRDIYWMTPDPLGDLGVGDGSVLVPRPHHALADMREGWVEP